MINSRVYYSRHAYYLDIPLGDIGSSLQGFRHDGEVGPTPRVKGELFGPSEILLGLDLGIKLEGCKTEGGGGGRLKGEELLTFEAELAEAAAAANP